MPVEISKNIDCLGGSITVCPRKNADKDGKFQQCLHKENPRECKDYRENDCRGFYIVTTSANLPLAEKISEYLDTTIAQVARKFGNDETIVELPSGLHGKRGIIFNPGNPNPDTRWVESMQMVQAARLSSADPDITFVSGEGIYSRQDEKDKTGVPVTSNIFAKTLLNEGAKRYVTLEYHSPKNKFASFNNPADDLHATFLMKKAAEYISDINKVVVVSPDAGGQKRADRCAQEINVENVAIGVKTRDKNTGKPKIRDITGDVKGKIAFVFDDMLDSGGSAIELVNKLYEKKADRVIYVAVHPVLSGDAVDRIEKSRIEKVFVSDTIDTMGKIEGSKIEVVSSSLLFARAFCYVHCNESLSPLFTTKPHDSES
jgi:ribose-phosphate pyrophosphokinase